MNDDGRSRQAKLDDLDITKQELDSIGEALKNEQFRKLLCEYVDEINDPENRAQYEREIEQYELERGIRVTFVRPQPGYVMKTSADGVRKVFINVCCCDVLQKPTSRAGSGGDHWSLPHCLSPVREDYDKAHQPCNVYDVVFHPDALKLAAHRKNLKAMIEDTALTMIEKNNNVVLDKANLKYPKIAFKGVARSLVIRKSIKDFQPSADLQSDELPGCPYKPPVDRPVQHHDLGALKQKSLFTVPKYIIKYRNDIDIQEHGYNMHCKMNAVIPKELIVEINLPLLDSSANVELEVLPKTLNLVCHKPSKYKLDINLPYSVLENEGNATFDQSTKKLIIRLPVLRSEPSLEYVKNLVSEVKMSKDENGHDCDIENSNLDAAVINNEINNDVQACNTMVVNKTSVTNGHDHMNSNDFKDNTVCNSCNNSNITENDVHYILPEHEFIFENKCFLTLNVKNVDPTSIDVIVIKDKNLISGKFHSIGSGFFPIWFAFCLKIPSESSLLKSDVNVLPSDKNVVLHFSIHFKPANNQYWYGLDQDNLNMQCIKIETLKENSKPLTNSVTVHPNDSDDDDDNDDDDDDDDDNVDDVFDNSKEEDELNNQKQQNIKKSNEHYQGKEKNGKTTKEKKKRKKGKKIQKSNAIPINVADSLPETRKTIDFIPGSLPIEFNNRPTIRGILKKRALSECSTIDDTNLSPRIYSSSVDNVDTESSDVLGSSTNDLNSKKTVRFNDHVIEKKIKYVL
ncbi:hypothetical protein ACI65C_002392 [Semiaphis heraclei]